MGLQIIEAGIEHINFIAPLFNEYRIFYEQADDIAGATHFLMERMSKKESTIFLALVDGEAVGFTQLYPIFSSVSLRPALLLNDLFVAENARQQGIANALLNKAKEYGNKTGAKWLLLETAFDNYNAQSVYEKNGWIKQTGFFYQFSLSSQSYLR